MQTIIKTSISSMCNWTLEILTSLGSAHAPKSHGIKANYYGFKAETFSMIWYRYFHCEKQCLCTMKSSEYISFNSAFSSALWCCKGTSHNRQFEQNVLLILAKNSCFLSFLIPQNNVFNILIHPSCRISSCIDLPKIFKYSN